ncbi:MAG: hypothetical protein LC754_04075 [Acidobacteria bacterium]|nr:hypothetical protein [Acidobacteriota bacterium]
MLYIARRLPVSPLFSLTLLVALAVASFVALLPARTGAQTGGTRSARVQPASASKDEDLPPFHDYKGVTIGMSADEARQKLGTPTDKGDKQDFYVFSDNETAQVFYDDAKKVYALSIIYTGASGVPACKAVLGSDAQAKADGSMHKLVNYQKAGYWVAYSRTAGDSPMTSITMQKKQ